MSSEKNTQSNKKTYAPPHKRQRSRRPKMCDRKSAERPSIPIDNSNTSEFSRDVEGMPIQRHFLYGQNTYKNQWRDLRNAQIAKEEFERQLCKTSKEDPCMCRTVESVVHGQIVQNTYIENSNKWLEDNDIYLLPRCGEVCDCGSIGGCNCTFDEVSDDDNYYTIQRYSRYSSIK